MCKIIQFEGGGDTKVTRTAVPIFELVRQFTKDRKISESDQVLLCEALLLMARIVPQISLTNIHAVLHEVENYAANAEPQKDMVPDQSIEDENPDATSVERYFAPPSREYRLRSDEKWIWDKNETKLARRFDHKAQHRLFCVKAKDDPDRKVVTITKKDSKISKIAPYVPTYLSNAEIYFFLILRMCRYEFEVK